MFRRQAVDHHRASAMGVVVGRQHRATRWAMGVLGLCLVALGLWLLRWEVEPGQNLLTWILAYGLPRSG